MSDIKIITVTLAKFGPDDMPDNLMDLAEELCGPRDSDNKLARGSQSVKLSLVDGCLHAYTEREETKDELRAEIERLQAQGKEG